MTLPKVIAAMLLSSALTVGTPVSRRQSCPSIQIITARGSTEPPGEGDMGTVAAAIADANEGVARAAVDYPAKLTPYDESSSKGTAAVTKQLTDFVGQCPDSKIVLLGYSQGAHIIGDSLCGGGGVAGIGEETPPISTDIGEHVTAIIQYGDPRFILDQSYNVGDADNEGLFPRQLPKQSCDHYADRIQSYCDDGDPFCEQGSNISVHLGYVEEYTDEAVKFVNSKLQG